jgi:hypothetical protein
VSINDNDKKLYESIYKAIVPKGLRPESQKDIDAMLETIGGEVLSQDKFQRMLRKIKGEEPLGFEAQCKSSESAESLTSREEKLVVLYREQGKAIPPEIQKKLEDMRKRAQGKQDKGKV